VRAERTRSLEPQLGPVGIAPLRRRSGSEHCFLRNNLVSYKYCASGTEEGVILVVARTFPDNYYEMDACLRGPELGREASEIQAMIASTKVLQP